MKAYSLHIIDDTDSVSGWEVNPFRTKEDVQKYVNMYEKGLGFDEYIPSWDGSYAHPQWIYELQEIEVEDGITFVDCNSEYLCGTVDVYLNDFCGELTSSMGKVTFSPITTDAFDPVFVRRTDSHYELTRCVKLGKVTYWHGINSYISKVKSMAQRRMEKVIKGKLAMATMTREERQTYDSKINSICFPKSVNTKYKHTEYLDKYLLPLSRFWSPWD